MTTADLIQDATSSIGTGNMTVTGAAILQRRPLSTFPSGTTGIRLKISGQTGGEYEISSCTITGTNPTTFSRDVVFVGSNGGALVNFSAGIKDVVCTFPAEDINKLVSSDTIPFSTIIPLINVGMRFMPPQNVTGTLTFTPSATLVQGASVYLRLTADGTHPPSFPGFTEMAGPPGWLNTAGIVNIVQFWHDGMQPWFAISQALGATPAVTTLNITAPSNGVIGAASGVMTIGGTPSGGTMPSPITITPSDSGAGGVFTPATLSGLGSFTYTPSGAGNVVISFTNSAGLVNPSNIIYVVSSSATVPGAPTIGTVVGGNAQASVPFSAPGSNGGSSILSYTATSTPGNFTGTVTQAGSGTITVAGLTNGTAYTFTVHATNSAGNSAESAASNSVTPGNTVTVPGIPTIGTVSATSATSASVPFIAPGSNGGATITSYTATSTPGSLTGTITQSGSGTISVNGLTTGTQYTFTVHATNSAGAGAESAASNAVTPAVTFTTWNPADVNPAVILSGGNLIATGGVGANGTHVGFRTIGSVSAGQKRYWEAKVTNVAGGGNMIGIGTILANEAGFVGSDAFGYGYYHNGPIYHSNSSIGTGATYNLNDVIGIALDLVNNTVQFFKTNVPQGSPISITPGTYFPMGSIDGLNVQWTGIFDPANMNYSPPAGFTAGVA